MTQTLDQALLDAHERADSDALIHLYQQAAQEAETEQATGFFLTHAYVFALECGDTRASSLRHELVQLGRETLSPADGVQAQARAGVTPGQSRLEANAPDRKDAMSHDPKAEAPPEARGNRGPAPETSRWQ